MELKFALCSLSRSPVFTLAIAILALGIARIPSTWASAWYGSRVEPVEAPRRI